jgi:hypothetical protein
VSLPEVSLMEWAYVAGYFDGEGTIVRRRMDRGYQLEITNTDLRSLQQIQRFVGAGSIRQRTRRNMSPRHRPAYRLGIYRRKDAVRLCRATLPYLIVKKDKARFLLDTVENQRFSSDLPTKTDPDFMSKVRHLYWDRKCSLSEVAKILGVNAMTLLHFMMRSGIPRRSRSEAARLWQQH